MSGRCGISGRGDGEGDRGDGDGGHPVVGGEGVAGDGDGEGEGDVSGLGEGLAGLLPLASLTGLGLGLGLGLSSALGLGLPLSDGLGLGLGGLLSPSELLTLGVSRCVDDGGGFPPAHESHNARKGAIQFCARSICHARALVCEQEAARCLPCLAILSMRNALLSLSRFRHVLHRRLATTLRCSQDEPSTILHLRVLPILPGCSLAAFIAFPFPEPLNITTSRMTMMTGMPMHISLRRDALVCRALSCMR